MLEITYLTDAKEEKVLSYPDYDSYQKAQMGCSLPLAEHYQVKQVTYKGHNLAYTGNLGGVFYFLLKQDLTVLD